MPLSPYRARVDARAFLNLPGLHAGAFVMAYMEDTSERPLGEDYRGKPLNFEPRMILAISDCERRIDLSFEVGSATRRHNAFHKIDTLIAALTEFREGLVDECRLYREREALVREASEDEPTGTR